MTPVIKFSNSYTKMPTDPSPSTLLEVFASQRDDLSNGFIEYDTRIVDAGNYKLSDKKLLVLLLKTRDNVLWTTIRRFTPCKSVYYMGLRGKEMNIVITAPNQSLNDYL